MDVGETIDVDETRAGELARLGLAEPVKGGAKAAPAPQNKAAPALANKDETGDRAITVRKAPGRPRMIATDNAPSVAKRTTPTKRAASRK